MSNASGLPDILHEGDGWRMRLATPADNARLCGLFRDVDMTADLCLAEERDPDFFALHRAQSPQAYSVMLEDSTQAGRPAFGCASILARDAWYGDEIRRVGYACDLRIENGFRGARVFPAVIDKFMSFMQEHEGIDLMYSAVLSSNQRGRNALLNQNSKRTGQPVGQVMTAYNMTAIQFVGARMPNDARVQRAQESDRAALVAFLAKQQQQRLFGYVVDDAWLQSRLEQWPGMCLADFFILKDATGRVLACAAPWDTEAHLRRSRVIKYQGKMQWLRLAYNAEARLRGFAKLPVAGDCFHFVYLTHLEVENDQPELLNALLCSIYNELRTQPLHFMSLMVPIGSPLEAGLKGFRLQRMAMELLAFSNARSAWHGRSLSTLRPGFEMALH
jgi:hypothetical protein